MNDEELTEHIRGGLATLAGPPAGADAARRAVGRARSAAGRRRAGAVVWLAAAAVVVLLAGAGTVTLLIPGATRPAAPGTSAALPSITAWPARGNLATDESLITRAENVWRSAAPAGRQPGSHVTALYAGTVPDGSAGSGSTVVMLLSHGGNGTRVGIVSSAENLGGPPRASSELLLRSVVPLDAAAAIRSVGFVAAGTPADHPSGMSGSLGYVLLAPGMQSGQVQSSMVDSIMSDADTLPPAPTGLVPFHGFPGSGPWNSWVVAPPGATGTDVLGGPAGGPSYTSGQVDSAGVVTSDDGTALHTGDLVVARDDRPAGNGLLGVVTSSDGRSGTLDPSLANLNRWGLQAISVSSNYRGTLSRGGSGDLVFTTEQPDAPNGVSRVVVRTADGAVTVNVGAFHPTEPDTPNTTSPFPLKQTDTLPESGSIPVWIIATGA